MIIDLYSLHRSEWGLQCHGPLWAWKEASSWICLHHAQSHERSGKLCILLANTLPEEAQPGESQQVRGKGRKIISDNCGNLNRQSFLFSARVPQFTLLHGTSDFIVPVESSLNFSELLTSLSVKVTLYLLPGVDHTEIATDLMASNRRFYHLIYSCVKQEFRRFVGTCWLQRPFIGLF